MTRSLWPSETANDMMLAILDAHQNGEPLCQRETCEFDGHCSFRTRAGRSQILDRLIRDGMLSQIDGPRAKRLSVPTRAGLDAWRCPLPTNRVVWRLMTAAGASVTGAEVTALARQLRALWRTHYEIGRVALADLAPLGDSKQGKYVSCMWRNRDSAMVEAVLDAVEGVAPSRILEILGCP